MFAKNAIVKGGDWDKSLEELFDYYQGEYISYDDWGGTGSSKEVEDEKVIKYIDSTYDVKTSACEYRFSIQEYTEDTEEKDNVGILSLYVIKMKDDIAQKRAYTGDGKNAPGINIGKTYPKDKYSDSE